MVYQSNPFSGLGNVFAESMCICTIMIIVTIVLFIVFLAWLIGGGRKKTEVHYHQQQPVQQPIQQGARYCPDCGRSIPFDAQVCPYCSKRF